MGIEMTGPICKWCGGYLNALDEHDEDACYVERQRQVYQRGRALAQAEMDKARAEIRPTATATPEEQP